MKNIIAIALCLVSLNANLLSEDSIRFFGGYSENEVKIVKSNIYTAPLVITEEIFTAKTPEEVDKAVENKQLIDIANGISAKEFLQERTGHLYGGLSESPLEFQTNK